MSRPRTAALFSHLALALAGAALGVSELDFIPETPVILVVYLGFVFASWSSAGRWSLPMWAVNILGLAIAGFASAWTAARLGDTETTLWLREVPLPVAIVPYLGPMLMGLTAVRLYCPNTPGDFWLLQGLGLLQVALGCVLTSGTLFGGLMLAYVVAALCAMAANERQLQAARSAPEAGSSAKGSVVAWLWFSLRWTLGVSLLALPLFLLTPRAEGPEWEPWSRFGYREPATKTAHTGFSEEIDLNRSGLLQLDDAVAFQVTVTDPEGRPTRGLPGDQRWRGVVLDRYENGRWRNSLSWTPPRFAARRGGDAPDAAHVHFRVPGRTGGLFLAEPVRLGPEINALPVWMTGQGPTLFHEFAGTIIPVISANFLSRNEYRYTQTLPRDSRDRSPALRTRGDYYTQIVDNCPWALREWTPDLLARLTAGGGRLAPLQQALRAKATTGDPLPHGQWETAARLLTDYLSRSGHYSYSLSFGRESAEQDAAVDFLFHTRRGPCERFATGLALMLRSVGIPARVIKGFRGAEETGEGAYQIRNRQAHAWVEALVLSDEADRLSFDWLTLDPTPDSDAPDQQATALSRLWQLQQTGQALWQDLIVGYSPTRQADLWNDLFEPGRWRSLVPWLAAGAVALMSAWLWRRRRRRWRLAQAGAPALYARLADLLFRRLHMTPRSDETPRELADRAAEAVGRRAGTADLASVPGQVVALFYEARFGGRAPGEPALVEARARLAALELALAE
jgi:protein-glutamine gamma-glutamyltransferase